MNRIYRIVWNATINRWVVASEVAKGRKKKTGRGEQAAAGAGGAAVMFAATLMLGSGVPLTAQAQIQGWSVAECYLFPSLYPKLCGGKKGGSPAPAPAPSPAPANDPPRLPEGSVNTFKYFKANSDDPDASATGDDAIAVGPSAVSSAYGSIAMGMRSKASEHSATAVGLDSSATATWATAVGANAKAAAKGATAMGRGSEATSEYATALGYSSSASAQRATALGNSAGASGEYSTALGNKTSAEGLRSTAVGNAAQVTAEAARSVALGTHSVADRAGTVSVGNSTEQRQIVNVAAGTQGKDAVNVDQLKGVTKALGGGAAVDGKGNITAPSYTVNGNTYGNVGDALAAAASAGGASPYFKANSTGTAASASGVNAVAAGQNARATADRSVALGVDSTADRADSVSVGNATRQRQVVNMAAGTADTDAVNVGQLKASGLIDGDGNAKRAVLFDGPNGEADLKGRRIINVANAVADTDALTLAQLKGAGLTFNSSGTVVSRVVAYQPTGADRTAQPTVVLEDNTLLRNVAAGKLDTDAANVGQVHDIVRQSTSVQSLSDLTATRTRAPALAGQRVEHVDAVQAPLATRAGTGTSTVDIGSTDVPQDRASLPSNGSGIKADSNASLVQFYANDYLRATGRADSAGSAPASDAAIASVPASVAIGADSRALVENSTALGAQSVVTSAGKDSVALGAGSVANEANVVSVGTDGTTAFETFSKDNKKVTIQNQANTRRIVNMAAGRNDNDAVNVEQLKAVTTALGGGAGVGSDGTVTAPSYEVGGTKYGNVGDALKAAADAGTAGSALAVKYAGTDKTSVSLEGKDGTTITNVKAATADADAVNLKQLKDAGITVDDKGNVSGSFVAYDDAEKTKITLGGGKAGTTLANVKAGTADTDAVNVSQLKNSGLIDDKGNAQKAVLFNGTGGAANAAGTKLVNLAAGSADTDGVNFKQLKDAGLTVDDKGNVSNSFVAYDGSDKTKVTFAGGKSGTTLSNVAKGVAGTDAVNIDQLKGVTSALGGGAAVGTDGAVTAPSYEIGGTKYGNVGDALKAAAASGGATDPLAVKYAGSDKTELALEGGKNGTTISNLKAATADDQAVNFKQLKDAGLTVDDKGNVTNSFVAYDDADKTKVTFGGGKAGTTLSNVKAGTADTDAVNVSQLKNSGLVDDKGVAQKAVLFNGPNSEANAAGTKLVNLAAGTTDTDGVNLKQLKDAGITVDDKGNVSGSFVAYDDAAKSAITLGGGKTGTTIGNLKAGTADDQAVNFKQLKDAGLTVDDKGNVSNSFVAYDGSDKTKVTFGGGKAGTTLSNVAKGVAGTDAVNIDQLKGVTSALGGGAAVGTDGTVTAPSYEIGGTKYGNVGDALKAAAASGNDPLAVKYAGSDKTELALEGGKNGTTISNLKAGTADDEAVNFKQLKDAGLTVDDKGNVSNSFVAYDDADKTKVTFGGGKAGTTLSNVKAGTADTDAVNVSQLKNSGLIDDKGVAQKAVLFNGTGGAANAASQKLVNLAAGTTDTDGVNLKQLKDAGISVDDKGNVSGSFVAYDDAEKTKVTLGGGKAGTTLTNVKAGTADTDAVNVKQFKDAGLLDDKGVAQKAVLFNGANGDANAAGTKLVGLKAGTDDTDGVNIKQLKDAGITVDPTTGAITNSFVAYDAADKAKITLGGGKTGTTIANVKSATADDQAVNLGQLKDAGIAVDDKGKVTNAFVTYDDSKKGAITLGGGTDGTAIRNLKAGVANTDATNVSQLRGLATALGGAASVGSDGAIVAPSYSIGGNTYNTVGDALDDLDGRTAANTQAISDLNSGKGLKYFRANSSAADASATGDNATAMGPQAQASGKSATAAGASARATGESSSAFGNNAEASAINSTALGSSAKAAQSKAIAIGNSANANGEQAVVIGASAGASGKNAVALGASSAANGASAVALGNNARAAQANAVALGSGSVTDRANSVSVGSATQSRQVTNVGAGTSGTDAVNVDQLKGVTTALGGGAGVDSKGNVTAPSYEIGGSKYGNVGDALQAVADAGTAADALSVKYADADKTSIALEGDGGTTISNLKAATADTDAVNLKQLKDAGITVDDKGNVSGSFVAYDDAAKSAITLGGGKAGTTIGNLKAATADDQAVNFKQLKDAGLTVDDKGNVSNSFVAYDGSDKTKVTFGGGKAGTTLANVKAGVADTDAVNVSQLKNSGLVDDKGVAQKAVLFNGPNSEANAAGTKLVNLAAGTADTDGVNLKQLKDAGITVDDKGNVSGSFVAYDDAEKTKITLGGGKAGTTLANVKAGTADTDAVNVSQLKNSGLIDDKGNAQKAVLFNGTGGAANAAGTKLVNLAAGSADTDGVNFKQLKDAGLTVDDKGNVSNSFVAYDGSDKTKVTFAGGKSGTTLSNVAKGVAGTDAVNIDQLKGVTSALGGGAAVGTDGAVTAPSYEIGGTKYGNVGDALKAAAATGGATDPLAVKYASSEKTSIALEGGKNGTTISNLKAATADDEAVNFKQLKDAGLTVDDKGNVTNSFVAYDDADKTKITFGGGKAGTTLSNVKAGTADTDAVNVSQLKNAGLIDDKGVAQKAVLFNGPNGEANANGTKLVNVAAGTATTDAVNIGQLAQSGLFDSKTGNVLRGITYVAGSVEAGTPRIELEKGTGNSRWFVDPTDREKGFLPAGTRISNVADGVVDTDATNLGQVRMEIMENGQLLTGASASSRAGRQLLPVTLWPQDEVPATRAGTTAQSGSGAKFDDTNANKVEFYANNYLRATGRADSVGSATPTDHAFTASAGSIAIGADSQALTSKTTAVGAQSVVTAEGTDSVALGTGSVANEANVVSVGNDGTTKFNSFDKDSKAIVIQNPANTRRIVNMAAGFNDNDAVNVSQLKQVATALGGGAAVAADGSVTQPTYTVGGGSYSSVGEALQAVDARATTGSTLGIAYDDDTHGKVTFSGEGGTTLSNVKAGTADTDAVNVSQLKASGLVDAEGKAVAAVTYDDAGKTAITLGGKGATTPVRLKNVADAQADDEAVNLKQLKTAGLVGGDGSTLDAVVYDEGSSKGMVSFGGAAGTVLNNVADGNIAAGSRQAVNGGQIDSLRNALEGKISGLDGRVTKAEQGLKNATGSVPYVSVKGPGADANGGADGSGSVAVGGDSSALAERSVAVGNGAKVQAEAPNAVALGSNSVADRANTVSVGAPGSERAIANVANGTADTDAVNVRQMNQGIQSAKDYTDGKVNDVWNTINRDVDRMNRQVNRGIAAASALVNVTPYLPGRTAINAGVASYRGEAALGVGLSRWSDNGRFNFNAGISAAKDDEPVYRVGVGYVF